jgi:hypothetical protein
MFVSFGFVNYNFLWWNSSNPNQMSVSFVGLSCFFLFDLSIMPKAASHTFYNHNARPATGRQLQASTTTSGSTILSYISTNVFVNPPNQGPHPHSEFYAMDFDDTSAQVDTTDDLTNEDEADVPTVIPGTGITVVPPAKRYHNSVSIMCIL